MATVSFSGDIKGTDDLDVMAHRLQASCEILVVVAGLPVRVRTQTGGLQPQEELLGLGLLLGLEDLVVKELDAMGVVGEIEMSILFSGSEVVDLCIEIVEPELKVTYIPDQDELQECTALGKTMAQKIKSS